MRRIAAGLASLLALLPACKGEAPPSPPPPEARGNPPGTAPASKTLEPKAAGSPGAPFLWAIDTDAGRSYLFGTMHLGVAADEDVHPVVWTSFAECDEVVLEIESSSLGLAQRQELLFMPEGHSLRKGLGADHWAALGKLVSGFPEDQLDRLSPLMASVLISAKWLPMKPPLDQEIESRARAQGKRVMGMETFEETKEFARSAAHVEYLSALLDDIEKAKKELRAMHAAYLTGDEEAMTALVFSRENLERFPDLYEQLFYQRNRAWVPKISRQIAAGKVFVAVGAGHLLGDKSVIALLREQGLKVERVRPAR